MTYQAMEITTIIIIIIIMLAQSGVGVGQLS